MKHRIKHAIKEWRRISRRLSGKTILLFLDFDGTLTPIVPTPSKARLHAKTRNLLKKLNSLPNIKLAIIRERT